MSPRILVIEDDPAISFGLKTNLSFEGYLVEVAETRAAAEARVSDRANPDTPDLIVLDLMLPDGSGFEVMETLARVGYGGRVLVLSARKEETDKVGALRMGADDYVTKPFSLAELLARIEALLRRGKGLTPAQSPPSSGNGAPAAPAATTPPAAATEPQRVRFGRCEIDLYSRTLRVDLDPVTLTRLEFDLLLYFAQHPGQALSRAQLLRDVWGLQHEGSARTVDNVIAHLRTKIGEDADRPRHLRTLRGAGYRFDLDPASNGGPEDKPGDKKR